MELVHGVPITKYCDDNHLTPRQRLELFVPVCQDPSASHIRFKHFGSGTRETPHAIQILKNMRENLDFDLRNA